MSTVVHAVGRIAIVAIFIVLGVSTLMEITAVSALIKPNVPPIPDALRGPIDSLTAAVGRPVEDLLAVLGAALYIAAGLLIAFGTLTRTAAIVLLILVAITTFYMHNFWAPGPQRWDQAVMALYKLSIMGALLVLIAAPHPAVPHHNDAEPAGETY